MTLSAESLSTFFPYYLTEERKKGLLAALRQLPDQKSYYAQLDDSEPLQGDGWAGLQVFRFDDGARDRVKGIVLTNSCDLSADNSRLQPSGLTFAPLVPLALYLSMLERGGVAPERVRQHVADIRAQFVTGLFFLPKSQVLAEEHIALLLDVHTMPLAAFVEDGNKARMFSLSDIGFYLFVFKLSVHFCRLHENIDRSSVLA